MGCFQRRFGGRFYREKRYEIGHEIWCEFGRWDCIKKCDNFAKNAVTILVFVTLLAPSFIKIMLTCVMHLFSPT